MNLKELVVQFNTAKVAMDSSESRIWDAVDTLLRAAGIGELYPLEDVLDAAFTDSGNLLVRTRRPGPGPAVYDSYEISSFIVDAPEPEAAAILWQQITEPAYKRFGRDYEVHKISQQIAELQAKLTQLTTP